MILDVHTHHRPGPKAIASLRVTPWLELPPEGLFSVGIHPWDAAQATDEHLRVLERLSADRRVVAIGETGLDALRGADPALQERLMEVHVGLSERLRKPLVIHMVRTAGQVVGMRRRLRALMPWVIHGFRGNVNVARMLLTQGMYLSVGERFNEQAVRVIPAHRLLVETDESSLTIGQVIERVAQCRGDSPEVVSSIVSANARLVFGV